MALKPVIHSLEEVAEPLRTEYIRQADGTFMLDTNVEEHPALQGLKSALTHVRTELKTTKDEVAKYVGMNPEEYRVLKAQEQQIKEGKLIAEGKVDELVALRTQALRESLVAETTTERTRREALEKQLNTLVIDNAVQAAATKLGVKPTAVDDVLNRARSVFRTQDGQAVAFQGDNPVYAKDGVHLLGIEEWLSALPATASHLFMESNGAGAKGGTPGKLAVAGPGSVARGDQQAFLANLDAIAKGKVKVV